MVQPKQHPKSKFNKKPHVKKHGKSVDMGAFRSYLDSLGLKIIQVTADGNCFFRSMADQLEGSEEEHQKYRNMVVQYIMKNREDFEPFIEDGVPFDQYCKSMAEDGTWAGHMELQAASLVTRSNICIHRIMQPRWYIRNFHNQARIIHLSYHNEEHYNSVRLNEDPCNGPAKPIMIKADTDLAAASKEAKSVPKSKGSSGSSECITHADSIKLVMAGSGCKKASKVEQALQLVDNDVSAAIELLISEQGLEDDIDENDALIHSLVDVQYENGEWGEEPTVSHSYDIESTHDNKSKGDVNKNVPRNKLCPCGSKNKYKACCGSVKGASNSSTEYVSCNQRVAPSKKDKTPKKQQIKKGGGGKNTKGGGAMNTRRSREENLPDMGALCI
ncbi:ubiquitinyl hydrolase 1 [Ranunculus cassubicifolius]